MKTSSLCDHHFLNVKNGNNFRKYGDGSALRSDRIIEYCIILSNCCSYHLSSSPIISGSNRQKLTNGLCCKSSFVCCLEVEVPISFTEQHYNVYWVVEIVLSVHNCIHLHCKFAMGLKTEKKIRAKQINYDKEYC